MTTRKVWWDGAWVEIGGGGGFATYGAPASGRIISGSLAPAAVGGITTGQTDAHGGTLGVLLDGSTGYYTLTPRVGFTGSIASYVTWLKTTSTDSTSGYAGNPANVIFGDSTNSVGSQVGVHDGKFEYRRFNNSTWQTVTHPTAVNDGAWHHCVAVYDGAGGVKLYVDGDLHSASVTHHSSGNGGINRIGAGYLNGSGQQDFFNGSLYLPQLHPDSIWKPFPLS